MRRPNAEALELARREARATAERLRIQNAGLLPENEPFENSAEKTPVPDEDPPSDAEKTFVPDEDAEEAQMAADDSMIAKPVIEIVYVEEDSPEV